MYSEWLAEGVEAGKNELRFDCPSCGEAKKKFYWNKKLGVGHCFKCGYAANIYRLAKDASLDLVKTPPSLSDVEDALDRGEENDTVPPDQERALPRVRVPGVSIFKSVQGIAYMLSRGVSPLEMKRYRMRYDSSFPARVILPICSANGRVVGWTGRATNKFVKPKYKNNDGFQANKHLFGAQFVKPGGEIVIVEGPLDQIKYGAGAVATFGKHMTKQQRRLLLKKLKPSVVAVMWDPDAAREAEALAEDLRTVFKVKLVSLPEGQDPGSMKRRELRDLVKSTPFYKSDEWLKSEIATS